MATIIDSLIVTLGLDPKPYQKGAQEAETQNKKTKETIKKGGNEIADALKGVATEVGLLLLGFDGLKGAINFFTDLNKSSVQLGLFSKNLGASAHEINTWGGAIELAMGDAKEAQGDLQNLSASITALNTTGTVSPLLQLFSRLQISLYDSQGKLKKFTDLYLELGNKLQGYSAADAFNLARTAGISESTYNLISKQADERKRLLDLSEQHNKENAETVKQAQALAEEWVGIDQTIKGIGTEIKSALTPAIKTFFNSIQQLINDLRALFAMFQPLVDKFKQISNAIDGIADKHPWLKNVISGSKALYNGVTNPLGAFLDTLHQVVGGKEDAEKAKAATNVAQSFNNSGVRNNNPGNLRFAGQAGATADASGFAVFPSLAAGIAAANRQLDLYAKRGINTIDAIVNTWAPAKDKNNVPAYISDLVNQVGKGKDEQLSAVDRQRLLQAIFSHEGNRSVGSQQISSVLGPQNNALTVARIANSQGSAAPQAPGSSTASTNVHIEHMTINTQATDANGIASDLPGALRRKGVVAQADNGLS